MSNQINLKRYCWELLRELFDVGTPLHYRVHISNPKTVLQELHDYISITTGTIHLQQEHINSLIEEYLYRAEKDAVFQTYNLWYSSFHEFLQEVLSYKADKADLYSDQIKKLFLRIKPIIRHLEENYLKECKRQIFDLLCKPDESIKPTDFKSLKRSIFSFSTEILRMGYSRYYIYEQIKAFFISQKNNEQALFDIFTGEERSYGGYLKIICKNQDIYWIFQTHFGSENIFKQLPDKARSVGMTKFPMSLFDKFLEEKTNVFWVYIETRWIDYIWAINEAKKRIHTLMDEIKFEFLSDNLNIFHHGLVIEECNTPHMVLLSDSIYIHRTNSSTEFFQSRNASVQKIFESPLIQNESKEKLKTLFRFYRYFIEADTFEHKFLNLWIGWEHIFSLSITKEAQTWKNIQRYFPYIFALGSTERILRDILQVQFHRNNTSHNKIAIRNDLNILLWEDNRYQSSNLYQLIKEKSDKWDTLIAYSWIDNDDLTKVKLFRLNNKFKDPQKSLKQEKNKTLWSLRRMYRVRNSIVHRGHADILWLPTEILTAELEVYYKILLDVIIERFSVNKRFENIDQLFSAFERTYESLLREKGLSGVIVPKEIKKKLISPPLLF